jgi:hypothetical protein
MYGAHLWGDAAGALAHVLAAFLPLALAKFGVSGAVLAHVAGIAEPAHGHLSASAAAAHHRAPPAAGSERSASMALRLSVSS